MAARCDGTSLARAACAPRAGIGRAIPASAPCDGALAGARDRAIAGRAAARFVAVLVLACLLACAGGLALTYPEPALAVAPSAADDLPLRDDGAAAEGDAGGESGQAEGADGADAPGDGEPSPQDEDTEGAGNTGDAADGAAEGAGGEAGGESTQGEGGIEADPVRSLSADILELDPELAEDNRVNPQQLPDSSFIYDTSIADLSTADAYIDGQTVQVVGEAIGDNLRATFGDRQRWITLSSSDDSSTIAVIMSAESASRIDTFGAYNVRGTIVQVRGIFHLVCAEHEGVSDLHAEVVNIVEKGVRTEDPFALESFLPGAAAVAVGLLMMGLFYFLRERRR